MFFFVQLTQVLHVITGGALVILFTECQIKNVYEIVKDPIPLIILLGFLKLFINEMKHSKDQIPGCFTQESSPTPQFKSINSSVLIFLYSSTLTSMHDYWKNQSFD